MTDLPTASKKNTNNKDNQLITLQYEILELIRSGNNPNLLKQKYTEYQSLFNSDTSVQIINNNSEDTSSFNPLHYCVQCGSLQILEVILSLVDPVYINKQDKDGNTPLHLASKLNRLDVVQLLYTKHNDVIDDSISNKDGLDNYKLTDNKKVKELIKKKRNEYLAEKEKLIISHLQNKRFEEIKSLFDSSNRLKMFFNVNKKLILNEHELSTTMLHEAARSRDEVMTEWLLNKGADIFVTNNNGKHPVDLTNDKSLKIMLIRPKSDTPYPVNLEGMLLKWTNLAHGYRPRYFVLESGTACKGSVRLDHVSVNWKPNTVRFTVMAPTLYYDLKTKHPLEAKKWVLALMQTKEWLKYKETSKSTPTTFQEENNINETKKQGRNNMNISMRLKNPLHAPKNRYTVKDLNQLYKENNEVVYNNSKNNSDNCEASETTSTTSTENNETNSSSSEDADLTSATINLNSLKTQIELQIEMINKLENTTDLNKDGKELIQLMKTTSTNQKQVLQETIDKISEKDQFYKRKINSLIRKQKLWQNNLESFARDQHQLEDILLSRNNKIIENIGDKGTSNVTDDKNNLDSDEDLFFDAEDDEFVKPVVANSEDKQNNNDSKSINEAKSELIQSLEKSFVGYPKNGKFRDRLQMSGDIKADISLWSVLKNNIGKDLSKIAMPVEFNEPTSMLQRMCEDIEYSELLDIASNQENSMDRMLYVAAFAMSNYSSTLGRTGKPFNPLLGETFEYCRPDKGYRYVSEQVSHHPPISACYCESPNYIFYAEVKIKNKFWGKSMEVHPEGITHLKLKLRNKHTGEEVHEHYSWTKVISAMNNIIIGTMYIEHYGDMIINNHNTSEKCILTFKKSGWRSSNTHIVCGKVFNAEEREVYELGGRWDEKLVARKIVSNKRNTNNNERDIISEYEKCEKDSKLSSSNKPILLWKMTPLPDPNIAYHLTKFAVTLNFMTKELEQLLPPTDSRHRPDQREMEKGDFAKANELKIKIEHNQRIRRQKKLETNINNNASQTSMGSKVTEDHQPKWFSKNIDQDTNKDYWQFNDEYWSRREQVATNPKSSESVWQDITPIFDV